MFKKLYQNLFNKTFNKFGLLCSIFYFYLQLKANKLISKEQEFFILNKFLKKNDNVLDVGANIGRYSFRLANIVGQKGCVYSFEPMPRCQIIFSSLIFLSNIKNILFFNFAVGDKVSKVFMKESYTYKNSDFIFDTNTESQITTKKSNNIYLKYLFKIDDLKIDDKISFIKIDTENYEYQVLLGAKKLIKKNKPTILIEKNSIKAINYLKKNGYLEVKLFNKSRNCLFCHYKSKHLKVKYP